MTTREFDPVFSAALRNELEALADGAPQVSARRAALARPQVWITVATALVLILATVGVLRLTHAPVQPAHSGSQVVDPLTRITDPASDYYVARSVHILLDARGLGTGTHAFDVPAGVRNMRVYLNCSPDRTFALAIDGHDTAKGGCDRDSGDNDGIDVRGGTHTVTVRVAARTRYALTIIETPAPTVATGALIDPLQQVRDLRNPDAVTGDTRPLLRLSAEQRSTAGRFTVPRGVQRLRAFLVCTPAFAATRLRIDGHLVAGCMNSIAHWFDFTPSARSVSAAVAAAGRGDWALLVIPAPAGAAPSPENTLLPYPAETGTVLAHARGSGAPATGRYRRPGSSILLVGTCRGTGWLEIQTADGSTSTRGTPCAKGPAQVGFGGDDPNGAADRRWTVIPHGDISWTFTILADD